jgi:hypothetical protein
MAAHAATRCQRAARGLHERHQQIWQIRRGAVKLGRNVAQLGTILLRPCSVLLVSAGAGCAGANASPRVACTADESANSDGDEVHARHFQKLAPAELRDFIRESEAKGEPPCARAAELGYAKTVRVLLSAGASPHIADSRGRLPIHLAAWKGHAAVLEVLVAHDPSLLECPDKKYRGTPLTLAAMHGRVHAVRALLNAGANADAVVDPPQASRLQPVGGKTDVPMASLHGMNALHLAAMRGHTGVITELLESGADSQKLSFQNFSAQALAEAAGHDDVVHALRSTAGVGGGTGGSEVSAVSMYGVVGAAMCTCAAAYVGRFT